MTRLAIFIISAGTFGLSCAASAPSAFAPADSPTRIENDLSFLADDARQGRGIGTAGLDEAAQYIVTAFKAAGLEPGGTDGFLQTFIIDSTAPAAAHAGVGGAPVANVVGVKPGAGPLANQVVVLGAHYDHLGLGGMGSLEPDSTGTVHNGADDNASGTAALIEIARLLRNRRAPSARTLVLVAFTAEELGLIGSSYYAQHTPEVVDSTYAMINLDMVGRLREDKLAAFGSESAEEFDDVLQDINTKHGLQLATSGDGYGRSDHQSFFIEDIPVLHFFTGSHEQYHKPTDDTETINFEGTAKVAQFVEDVAWSLATRLDQLSFVDAEPRHIAPSSGPRPYLGTIPDMTESPGGVLLSGVTAGSPADSVGLQAGDVLIGIATFTIADLYDMQEALNALKPGDTAELRVVRGADTLSLRATLKARGN